MTPRRRLLVAGLLLLVPTSGRAAAATITYQCGPDLCSTSATGRGDHRLTTDGRKNPYFGLQNTRDGTRLAFSRQNESSTFLARRDATGQRDVGGYAGFSTDARRELVGAPGLLCLLTPFATKPDRCLDVSWAYHVDWRSRVFYGQADDPSLADMQDGICRMAERDGSLACAEVVARAVPGGSLREFDVSPDGHRLVTTEYTPQDGSDTRLVLFDADTGRRIRALTPGDPHGGAHNPSISPDGRTVVFEKAGSVFTVPATGGAARSVARGTTPVWTR